MGITDVFSKRDQPLPDVYQYDTLPPKLRGQLVHILRDIDLDQHVWKQLGQAVAREHGLVHLPNTPPDPSPFGLELDEADYRAPCESYVQKAGALQALDLIELAFRRFEADHGKADHHLCRASCGPEELAKELNHRFRENGVGYQYTNGRLIRVDSLYLHENTVKPALALLLEDGFAGPNEEFMSAHQHFRHGRHEEAITDACKAFESTIKAICTARDWPYDEKAAASGLVRFILDRGLVPSYFEQHLMGVATIRNKMATHGAGVAPREPDERFAAYALHVAASNIVLLVESHKALPL